MVGVLTMTTDSLIVMTHRYLLSRSQCLRDC
ncbi:hypothetical protein CYQXPUPM_0002 [Klebsiella phage Saitama]|uniref:Uncharacterized protein n=1 Tax=Klebsiella phage Saitama TaxID=3018528 RepID=A0AAF0D7Q5_9CAUD|nr:hypothetical protein CYQXPUPM_0002 [Klebsiella phage Saitama]